MEIAFTLGPFAVGWYGIMITTAAVAAIALTFVEARRRGQDREHVLNLALVVLPMGIIGARLYHVVDRWEFYSQNPSLIFGGAGLGIFGAVIGGVLGLIVYTRWRKLSTLRWLDIIAPGLILAQAIGRWGNFINQELYGYPSDLPWAIQIDPAHRLPGYESFSHFQPLFLYESLWNFLGCFLLLLLARKLKKRLFDGDIFFLYVIYYSVGRFFLEGLKIDAWTTAGIPVARWITGIVSITLIAVMLYRRYRLRRAG